MLNPVCPHTPLAMSSNIQRSYDLQPNSITRFLYTRFRDELTRTFHNVCRLTSYTIQRITMTYCCGYLNFYNGLI